MHLGEIAGWSSVALGQLVSWPQVLKLRRERGEGVSLASYAIVNVSMTLFFLHAIAIGDTISMVSVPVSMIPNVVIAITLVRRRAASLDTLRARLSVATRLRGTPLGRLALLCGSGSSSSSRWSRSSSTLS